MCKLSLASTVKVYTGPTASTQKSSQIFQGMVTLFRESLVEVHIVIKYLHRVDETDLNRLLSLDWLASQEILNNYLAKHFQKHILLSKFHLTQRIGIEPASLPLLLEIVSFFQVIARSKNENPRTHTFFSSKLKSSLGPSPLPGPPLRHSLLLAKETRFIIYSTAHLYIKVTYSRTLGGSLSVTCQQVKETPWGMKQLTLPFHFHD